ncbi:TIGR03862 family flavoprotein [Parasedimentitalea marina]|uniref:TIGR03862 family flavoprotein n=1 Tax=Parasedimentitalea marina TaxID=2483033 RepID=A0A3T0N7A2_9RHOB|nr:TIGR03862 family flavoprotein [Parasedimentitalea marina]AZV79865.1 TIGR03862 family flavoprotein [Parasedimentitalea marina]
MAMNYDALVIGAGPAGLMAAEELGRAGQSVLIVEAKPSVARKLLMAGKSGLNLTKDEPFDQLIINYGKAANWLAPMVQEFDSQAVQDWARGLGIDLFTGSTGRVFPKVMKASPLVRAWLNALDALGVERRTRWSWQGWSGAELVFDTPEGTKTITAKVTVLALGGASWARLGSDGLWAPLLADQGVAVTPLQPANVGLVVDWSDHIATQFGAPLKGIALQAGELFSRGEAVISKRGLEGGGIYAICAAVRDGAALTLDLLPDLSRIEVERRLSRSRGKASLSNHLRKVLKLDPARIAVLQEFARPLPQRPSDLAEVIKALPVKHAGLRPIDEAISTAGGVARGALDEGLMLQKMPGVFCAGEMLDWEAPTGGYLLTGCLATGRWAGRAAARYLAEAVSAG